MYYRYGDGWETRERFITYDIFQAIGDAVSSGRKSIVFEDMILQTGEIRVVPANDEITELLGQGIKLEQIGLPAPIMGPMLEPGNNRRGFKQIVDGPKVKLKNLNG